MRVYRIVAAAAIALSLLPPIPTIAADDAQSLLAKHRSFVGWQFGDGSISSLRLERQLTNEKNETIERASETRIDLVYRRDYSALKLSDNSASVGFTGRVFWGTSRNGFTVPFVGDLAKYYLATDAMFMEGASELPAAFRGTDSVDGKPVSVVRVTMSGAAPMDLYIDPETGAFSRVVVDPDGTEETRYDIHSYMDIGHGKKMIGSWSIDGSKSTYSYTKATVNSKVTNEELHPPAPTAAWDFKSDKPFKIKVTSERIYVDAVVNGVPGRFILDTGASEIAFTDDFANRAKAKDVGKSKAYGIGGDTKTRLRSVDTIQIGGNTLSNVVVSTLNERFEDKAFNEEPAGLIGFDLFAAAIVDVNTSDQTMRIREPSSDGAQAKGGIPVIVDLADEIPRVPMRVNGKVDVNAEFDTGNTSYVLVSKELRSHGVAMAIDNSTVGYLSSHVIIRGIGGDESVTCGQLATLTLGPIVYQNPQACESYSFGSHEALIGFDFLQHFDYVFDYPHSQIIMTPRHDQ